MIRLLEYHVSEGWEPLCRFLGCRQPSIDFPTGNDMESFRKRIRAATRQGVKDGLQKAAILVLAFYAMFAMIRYVA